MHFSEYARYRSALRAMIEASGAEPPAEPFGFALLTVVRHATTLLDVDNLYAGIKPLLDCLVTEQGGRHPDGLGFLVDDSPLRLALDVRPRLIARRRDSRTVIHIDELDPRHPAVMSRLVAMGLTREKAMALADGSPRSAGGAVRRSTAQAIPERMSAAEFVAYNEKATRRRAASGGRKRW